MLGIFGCGVCLVVAEAHDEDRGVQRRSDRSCRTDDGVKADYIIMRLTCSYYELRVVPSQ